MTLTALQKRCDQDDLAVNTEMVLTPLAAMQYGDSLTPCRFVGAAAKLKDAERPLYEAAAWNERALQRVFVSNLSQRLSTTRSHPFCSQP
jgi:hypothetical protein